MSRTRSALLWGVGVVVMGLVGSCGDTDPNEGGGLAFVDVKATGDLPDEDDSAGADATHDTGGDDATATSLCAPCVSDTDCGDGRCVAVGDDGSFCLATCGTCPDGFDCADGTCQPTTGSCTCYAGLAGTTTECSETNDYGTCAGERTCGPTGWSACNASTPAAEACNGVDDDCDGETDEDADAGSCTGANGCPGQLVCQGEGGVVCSAASPTEETCNGIDDDCDGEVDEQNADGCTFYYSDVDGDGYGDSNDWLCLCAPMPPWKVKLAGDCNDDSADVGPEGVETCNAVDDDCDGDTDEDLGGGECVGDCDGELVCKGEQGMSCNAPNASPESCNGVDDDCDGAIDEAGATGCTTWYADVDEDGVGNAFSSLCLCGPTGVFTTQTAGDCDDTLPGVKPGADEVCNGLDDDCDGATDPVDSGGCSTWYFDGDGDGFGDDTKSQCACGAAGNYKVTKAGDCDDTKPTVKPLALEVCNGIDDNCDGVTDPGLGGGPCSEANAFGECFGVQICDAVGGLSCSAKVPSAEVCNGGVDDNCDGLVDPADSPGCVVYYADTDNDGYGVADDSACLCAPLLDWTATEAGDCAPDDETIGPGEPEACTGADDDCDGDTDEEGADGCTNYYVDGDNDGAGDIDSVRCLCAADGDHTLTVGGDCDDSTNTIGPEVVETCNTIDDDCDGETDEDSDGDFCESSNGTDSCPGVTICTNGTLGCSVSAPAPETCDGLDNDCNGVTDDPGTTGCTLYFLDVDGDEYGANNTEPQCLCAPEGNYRANVAGDCNDALATVNPGAAEVCGNGDDNCDEVADPAGTTGCTSWYRDVDNDGWGTSESQCLCAATGEFRATKPGDCDDGQPGAYPENVELCSTPFDDNCAGGINEEGADDCVDYWLDDDNDDYGVGDPKCLCQPLGKFTATASGDCAPNQPDINPGVAERCDGIDNNCQGVDSGCDDDGDDWCDANLVLEGPVDVCPNGGGDCDDEDPFTSPGGLEVCDGKDNDCQNGIDDGVTAPCGGCATTCTASSGAGTDAPFEAGGEGTTLDADGNLVYDVNASSLAMLWIANSGEGTVSRLDTETGQEVARYFVCANPSRTAVDAKGNCWVACRGDGKVVQLIRQQSECIDKNFNGTIETSWDIDGNGTITPDEMLPHTIDECIGHVVEPEDGNARALAIDPAGDVWVGYWGSRNLHRIHDGEVTATIALDAAVGRPYGLAADNKGRLWIAMRDNRLGMIPILPEIGEFQQWTTPGNPYGVAIDGNGVVWMAGGEGQDVMWFDPAEGVVHDLPLGNLGKTRGVAVSLDGDLFVAHHTWTCQQQNTARWLTRIDTTTKTIKGQIDLGGLKGPIGLGIGFGGTLWSVNQCSNSVQRLNAETGEITGEFPVGNSPYTYSDMTGYQLRAVVVPQGYYRETFEGWTQGTTRWTSVDAGITMSPGAGFRVAIRVADTPEALAALEFQPVVTLPGGTLPVDISGLNLTGRYLEVEVTFYMQDAQTSPVLETLDVGMELLP